MSRHQGASGSLPSMSPSSPRPAAERRVLEQLAQQPPTSRRTLPRPASTSTAPVDPAAAGRSRRPRSRRFSSNEGTHIGQREPDQQELLTEILAEFPEIDATTVSVLLNMHNGLRGPVVQRLNEVYRRPGKEPQKRHSFPSSSPQERGRTKAMQSSASFKVARPARKSRPFSIDRIDDSEDESVRLDVDEAVQSVEPTSTVNTFFSAQIIPEDAPLPSGRRSTDLSRSSHSPVNQLARVHTTSSLSSRTRPLRRTGGGESSGGSGDSTLMDEPLVLAQARARSASGSEGGGTRETISSRASWTRRDERQSDGLYASWGQDDIVRPRDGTGASSDIVPGAAGTASVVLAPVSLQRAEMPPGISADAHSVFASVNVPQSVAVVAEQSTVRLRRTPAPPPPSTRESLTDGLVDEDIGEIDMGSLSSAGTSSSNVTGPTFSNSGVSSARSSVWSRARSGRSGSDEPTGRESTARAAAGALMRGLSSGAGRGGRTRDGPSSGPMSRRRRAKQSVKELGQAVRERARQYREQQSEGECDDDIHDAYRSSDSMRGGGISGDKEIVGGDSEDGGGAGSGDVVEPGARLSSSTRPVAVDDVMDMSDDQNEGNVTVSLQDIQRLVRKVTNAERTIAEMQTQRKEKVAALMSAVNEVRNSLVNFDKRQKQRFEDMSERFTGNNDSIERLSNDMWRIRRMLHEYEARRSRRFWRVLGMLLLDALAYVGLFVVWLCTSVYNVFVRQKRAITKLINSSTTTTSASTSAFAGDEHLDSDEHPDHVSTPDDVSLDGT